VATRTRTCLLALTLAFALGGAAFALATPLFQGPDEPAHVDLVRHYARHPSDLAGPDLRVRAGVWAAVQQTGLPIAGGPTEAVWPPGGAPARPSYPRFDDFPGGEAPAAGCRLVPVATCQNYHYVHPPTFYVLLAPAARVLDHQAFPREVLGLRLLCVLLVTPVVPLAHYTARQVWPRATRRPLAVAALVATFAPLLALSGNVNNDSLLVLTSAATIAATARLLRRPSRGAALAVGLAAGAGLLVKIQGITVALAAVLAVLVVVARRPRTEWAGWLARAFVPMAIGSAWWVYNLARYHGLSQGGGEILEPARPGFGSASPLSYVWHEGPHLVGRFWGLYGNTAVVTPGPWRAGLTIAAVVLGLVWLACRRWHRPDPVAARLDWVLAAVPVLLALGALQQSFAAYRRNGVPRGLNGRYLYPALPVLAAGVVAALSRVFARVAGLGLVRRSGNAVLAVGSAGAAALGLAGFARAMHGFYGTRSLGLALDRAAAVAPVRHPGPWLAVLGLAWLACIAVAVAAPLRQPVTEAGTGTSPGSDGSGTGAPATAAGVSGRTPAHTSRA
jgi:4-amino-4-deoxy-L-arabinose transferase-like glycosyltransferase